jgi:membrane-bound metal-dependent hydrolase YbcI (DUF457 family)
MFIGHFAVGFASKKFAPRVSLWVLLLAPLFLDVLWPVLVGAGVEHVRIVPGITRFTPLDLYDYPWSHSLLMSLLWSFLAGFVAWATLRQIKAAFVLALGVFSHWVLDLVTHRPDLPLAPGSGTYLGLGLWNSIPGTIVVEVALFAAGVWVYATATRAKDRVGSIGLWAFVGVLLLLYAANVVAPPPPSVTAIWISAIVLWLFFPLAAWIDRHREPVPT